MLRSVTLTEAELAQDEVIPKLPSNGRRWFLLGLLTLAYFLDVWCGSAAYVALSHVSQIARQRRHAREEGRDAKQKEDRRELTRFVPLPPSPLLSCARL